MKYSSTLIIVGIAVLIFGCTQSENDPETYVSPVDTISLSPEELAEGKVLYAKCASCHGHNAEGVRAFNSPALANQEDWYMRKQLEDLMSGDRRVHYSDSMGLELMLAAKSLNQSEVEILLSYIKLLPRVKTDQTIFGDLENGKDLFNRHCVECHGIDAKGLLHKQSPNLLGIQDYYIAEQLRMFREGKRGYAKDDSLGQVMREKARVLTEDQQIEDLVTYIHLLQTEKPKYY